MGGAINHLLVKNRQLPTFFLEKQNLSALIQLYGYILIIWQVSKNIHTFGFPTNPRLKSLSCVRYTS